MENITLKAQNLIERDNLGIPLEIYKPNITGSIAISLFIIIFGTIWCLLTIIITNGSHSIIHQTTSTVISSSSGPSFSSDPSSSGPSFSSDPSSPTFGSGSSTGSDTMDTLWTILGVVLPLLGLFIVVAGVVGIVKATQNRNTQAVVCTDGVAYVSLAKIDAFRWEQVLTIVNKTYVSTSTTPNNSSNNMMMGSTTHVTTYHKYNVHCQDGRTFTFDDTLSKVEDLAERIEVEVARRRVDVGY